MKSPHTLMVQGTTSDAGKSVLVYALCRILARQSINVAPMKPQNMALNSAVTSDGGEIGRAQAVQAQACYIEPTVEMNPVLLKPNSDIGAQVIVHGRVVCNTNAQEYLSLKPILMSEVLKAYRLLQDRHDVIIVEGAGSPAEINLRENDIANMGFAEAADCPVIIVADIDRGGVFAHLFGTYELLSESEKQRVVGFVINRFRGDASLLDFAISWLEEKTSVPVLAVIPYLRSLHIEAEDSIPLDHYETTVKGDHQRLNIAVIRLPHISNHTDFDPLRLHPDVNCTYVGDGDEFTGADLLIIPGSKNVRSDLEWLKSKAWVGKIQRHIRLGGKLAGICGGYQMLGSCINDPSGVEGNAGSTDGLGFIDMETVLEKNKQLRKVTGKFVNAEIPVEGYEIHAGVSHGPALNFPVFDLDGKPEGVWAENQQILGTYLHGLFDHPGSLAHLLDWVGLQRRKPFDYRDIRELEINRLADAVEAALSVEKLKSLLSLS